jgi:TRAP-type C4-dicarboxylate transport system permease small subunit
MNKKKKHLSFEAIVVAVDLIVMLALVFVGVLSRYLLHFSFSFTEELVCTGFVLLSTMGGALASMENGHYTLDLITGMMKPKTKKKFMILDTGLTILAAVILMICGIQMVMQQYGIGSVSIALKIPNWIYGSMVPFGLAFMIYRSVRFIIQVIKTDPEKLSEDEGSEDIV